ncbi:MAG: pyocin activator PrtN family protein [Sulfitobacter sp.]
MDTTFLLAARYDGAPLIDINTVRRDQFSYMALPTFIRRLEQGAIPLPVVRLSGSQKSSRMIPLIDLAHYIDAKMVRARAEANRK